MTALGFWLVVFAFVSSTVASLLYYRSISTGTLPGRARRWVQAGAAAIVTASFILIIVLLQHDFTNGYVFSYSSRALPLHYLVSCFYAGQEGSFLFWGLCSVVISLILLRSAGRTKDLEWVMTVFMAVQSFLMLLLIVKSPFRDVWEMFPQMKVNTVPADGQGLNPLLQNFWMAVHPPVLFLGFAAMAVPFSFAVGGMWKKDYSMVASAGFPWVLFSVLVLGLGIMLGAYWAYAVLGWGGYWGWDPVENSSLIPSIIGVALIHTMVAQRRSLVFIKTNNFLAVAAFCLVVYSTFLTRSGVLGDSSVHSFTDPGATVYWTLAGFLAALAFSGFGLLYARRADMRAHQVETRSMSREMALGLGTLVLLVLAVVVLFGTSLPIISQTTVEPSFYDSTALPFAILLALLIGYSLYAQWGGSEWREILRRSLRASIISVAVAIILFAAGLRDASMLLFALASVFALVVNLELLWKARHGGLRMFGGKLAHLGLALFFLGVLSTGKYSTTKSLSLGINRPVDAFGYRFTYTGNRMLPGEKYAFHVNVEAGGTAVTLAPVMFEAGEQGIMKTPDISSSFARDVYVSPVSFAGTGTHTHESYTIPKGGSISMGNVTARFVRFDMDAHGDATAGPGGAMSIGSVLELSNGSASETITPVAVYRPDAAPAYKSFPSRLMNANIRLVSVNVGMGGGASTVTVEVQPQGEASADGETLVVEASVKPFVNLLWGGTLIMFVGFGLCIIRRSGE